MWRESGWEASQTLVKKGGDVQESLEPDGRCDFDGTLAGFYWPGEGRI